MHSILNDETDGPSACDRFSLVAINMSVGRQLPKFFIFKKKRSHQNTNPNRRSLEENDPSPRTAISGPVSDSQTMHGQENSQDRVTDKQKNTVEYNRLVLLAANLFNRVTCICIMYSETRHGH